MHPQIQQLFDEFTACPSTDLVLLGQLPPEIITELAVMIEQAEQQRAHPLSRLKQHDNGGENAYQISVSPELMDASWLMAYLCHLGEYYIHRSLGTPQQQLKRAVTLRRHWGHFDHYDCWINFCGQGSQNKPHHHSGTLSGVIYWQNPNNDITHFDQFAVAGEPGQILIFPAYLNHWVDVQTNRQERITLSFNLIWNRSNDAAA
jgi:hypothetical protein